MSITERNLYKMLQPREAGFVFWLLWVVATTLGVAIGQPLEAIVAGTPLPGAFDILSVAGGGAVTGALIGIAQALVLMPYLKMHGAVEWFVATIFGRVAFSIVSFLYYDALSGVFLDNQYSTVCGIIILRVLFGGLLGVLLAYPQYLALRHRSEKRVIWLLANIGVSVITTYILVLGVGIAYGLIMGVVTGYLLVDILRHPTRLAEWRGRFEAVI